MNEDPAVRTVLRDALLRQGAALASDEVAALVDMAVVRGMSRARAIHLAVQAIDAGPLDGLLVRVSSGLQVLPRP